MLLAFTSRSPALKRARRIVVCLLHSVIQRCVETLLLPVSGEFRSFRATRRRLQICQDATPLYSRVPLWHWRRALASATLFTPTPGVRPNHVFCLPLL